MRGRQPIARTTAQHNGPIFSFHSDAEKEAYFAAARPAGWEPTTYAYVRVNSGDWDNILERAQMTPAAATAANRRLAGTTYGQAWIRAEEEAADK